MEGRGSGNQLGGACHLFPTTPLRHPYWISRQWLAAGLNLDSTIDDCRMVALTHRRQQGSTTEVIPRTDVPFDIFRVYYLYDVPGGAREAAMRTVNSSRCSSLSPGPSM